MSRIKVEAYVEEKEFIDKQGKNVKFLALVLPVTDSAEKTIKAEQFVLQLSLDRALNSK